MNLGFRYILLLILWLGVFIRPASAESLIYDVMKGKDAIGKLHIERTRKNNVVEYFFESTVKLTFIIGIEVYDKMKVTFKDNQLLQAYLYRTLNGKVKVNNTTTWNGTYYYMTNKDRQTKQFKSIIQLTTANLYYQEPVQHQLVFSEKFQQMIPIKSVSPQRYRMDLPNGNKTFYTYHNGICSLVEAETDWADLKFVLKKINP